MADIWYTVAEVKLEPGDLENTDRTLGFMKIMSWAEDEGSFLDKFNSYFLGYNWHILGTENTRKIDVSVNHGDEVQEMIDDLLRNRNHIRLGTLHTYPTN
jgi:hypothetical protein